MERPKLLDEFAALGLLRDEPPAPPVVVLAPTMRIPESPHVSVEVVKRTLLQAGSAMGDCIVSLEAAMASLKAAQEALVAVAEGLVAEEAPPVVEIEAEEPPTAVPVVAALADTAKLRAPVVALEAVIATTGGAVVRAPVTEAPAGMPWVAEPKPFGAAAVMVSESVPLPPEDKE
jgi:hypothetical protein